MGLFTKEKDTQRITMLEVALLHPNKSQPRKEFNDTALKSLADSIRENGIIQPICVRKDGILYEIISGERRTRAAKIAGLTEVPCIIMEVDDEKSAVLALIENIQRKDLSYFEEALAIEKLISVYGLTQEMAATRLGKAQSTIANKLRLLRFTDKERNLLISGDLSERQARALIRIQDESLRIRTLEKVVSRRLNLEQTEQLVNSVLYEADKHGEKTKKMLFPPHARMFVNSINKLVKSMRESDIPCESYACEKDGYYEYVIKIPCNN